MGIVMTKAGLCRLAGLAALVLLDGCSPFQPVRAVQQNVYVLQAASAATPATQRRPLTLLVSQPRAEPGFDSPRMAYVREPYRIDYYSQSRWADAPAHMLAPLLVHAIEQGGGFRGVVQGPSAAWTDLRLDTDLVRLQQEFLERPSRIHLTVRAQLVQMASRRVLATRQFDVVETADSEDAYGGVVAAHRALRRVLGEVAEFCAVEARRLAPAPGE